MFCRFGEGSVDLAAVLERLRGSGYDAWLVVEQDRFLQPGQTVESMRRRRRHTTGRCCGSWACSFARNTRVGRPLEADGETLDNPRRSHAE